MTRESFTTVAAQRAKRVADALGQSQFTYVLVQAAPADGGTSLFFSTPLDPDRALEMLQFAIAQLEARQADRIYEELEAN